MSKDAPGARQGRGDLLGAAAMSPMTRRTFGAAVGTLALSALPARAAADAAKAKLKVGVLLPRSGLQALIGQSCQKGADIAPESLRQRLGVDIELMNADTESNVDTARSRAERLIERGRARARRRVRFGAHRRGRAGGGAARRSAHRQHRRRAADHRAGLQVRVPELPARARDRPQRPGAARGHLRRGEGRSRRRPSSCTSTTPSGNRWPRASRRCCPSCRFRSSCSTPSPTIRRPRT